MCKVCLTLSNTVFDADTVVLLNYFCMLDEPFSNSFQNSVSSVSNVCLGSQFTRINYIQKFDVEFVFNLDYKSPN